MSAEYTLILRSCPEAHRESAAALVGKLFSLKEHTCQQIVASCPIVLLSGLAREEAAAIHLMVHGLQQIGAVVELSSRPPDLHKIDWPRRPQIFKRELNEWIADLQIPLPVGGGQTRLIDLLLAAIDAGRSAASAPLPSVGSLTPPTLHPPTTRTPRPQAQPTTTAVRTPLPPPPALGQAPGSEDAMARLNELFPDEEGGGFLSGGREDISNLLNKILPDESDAPAAPGPDTSSANARLPAAGFSVFLAKIADEDRRKKAVPLIAELGKITPAEAEALSKKMIIPVLRGGTKEEAEAAKAQFGKIGILARVKGPE